MSEVDFRPELRRRIDASGYSESAISKASGAREDFVRDMYRKPNQDPGVIKMHRLCRFLKCRVDDLFDPPELTQHAVDACFRLEMTIEEIGRTPEDIAQEFGVTTAELGQGFGGSRYPDLVFLTGFCQKYGFTTDWILSGVPFGVSASLVERSLLKKQA